ncbi:hypothetical protein QCM77_20940 [Bradyrhizobium sp. SSUT18]|uniref:hypothetical protein n=1 Tax=Bradyrhizobium sp. SSUT18 TaxID=3040602 RepID=UPI00244BE93C|nr:hypothetical protein [Bradyrhizobium sp. SSUT18]MDH2402409.1 hypothetical protein [Bradyrhizobium sp. SSUT18]
MELQYYNPSTLPARYAIAWCRFPLDQSGRPGKKLRPTLVRAISRDTESKRSALVVSYGTKKLKLGYRDKVDLVIQNAAQIERLGLTMATRFDLDLLLRVPWAVEFFAPPPHAEDIVTGSLNDEQIERFKKKLRHREEMAQLGRVIT